MAWLAIHMWLILLGAFLLGLLLGWWIWRCRHDIVDEAGVIVHDTPAASGINTAPQRLVSAESTKPVGTAPKLYTSPTDGPADDLKKVKGIGPGIEKLLHSVGIFYFKQIAAWTDDEVTWIDNKLQFPGRITRESWISQAKTLRDGGRTEFADRYDKGETPSSYHGATKGTGE